MRSEYVLIKGNDCIITCACEKNKKKAATQLVAADIIDVIEEITPYLAFAKRLLLPAVKHFRAIHIVLVSVMKRSP